MKDKDIYISKGNSRETTWITEKEMQKISGLRTTSLWKLRTEGHIIWSRIGRRVFYSLESFHNLLEMNSINFNKLGGNSHD